MNLERLHWQFLTSSRQNLTKRKLKTTYNLCKAYIKYSLDLRNYITVLKHITLASRINGGMITGWSKEYDQYETILFEKFYLGGSNTLRAIRPLRLLNYSNDNYDNDGDGNVDEADEDSNIPSGKEMMVLTNVELRFPLLWEFGLPYSRKRFFIR